MVNIAPTRPQAQRDARWRPAAVIVYFFAAAFTGSFTASMVANSTL
jgi:hypothetical protein